MNLETQITALALACLAVHAADFGATDLNFGQLGQH